MKFFYLNQLFFASVLLFASVGLAVVELPEEELARESVVPKFDRSVAVRNRHVSLSNQVELGAYVGWNFSEAIEGQSKFGLNLGYHFNETSSLGINYALWSNGLNTQYASALSEAPYSLDFSRAPRLQSSLWANYEWNVFYGKISITKETVISLTFFPIVGLGLTEYTNKKYIGANLGMGSRFYFLPNLALRVDLKLQYSGQPSPFLAGYMKSSDPRPSLSRFQDVMMFGPIFDIGVAFLF